MLSRSSGETLFPSTLSSTSFLNHPNSERSLSSRLLFLRSTLDSSEYALNHATSSRMLSLRESVFIVLGILTSQPNLKSLELKSIAFRFGNISKVPSGILWISLSERSIVYISCSHDHVIYLVNSGISCKS